jgi:uncharacterized membrane protein
MVPGRGPGTNRAFPATLPGTIPAGVNAVYQLLLYVHILSAITWVGGAIYAQLIALRVSRASDPAELPIIARHTAYLGLRVFLPASLLIIITGVAMTLQAWSFGQTWIAIAVALWVLSAALGGIYVGPRVAKVAELFEAEGPTSENARGLLNRLFLVSRLELVSFFVIVALMVFKPGA